MKGNFGFASTLLDTLKKHGNTCPVMISSSIQAALDNPYGESKRAGEQLLFDYAKETGAKVLVYRFPNLFGKWCRPNYNSAVATFCNNIANDLPITVNDPSVELHLVYIDDVVDELIGALTGDEHRDGDFCYVPASHRITLGGIVDLLHSFRRMTETRGDSRHDERRFCQETLFDLSVVPSGRPVRLRPEDEYGSAGKLHGDYPHC